MSGAGRGGSGARAFWSHCPGHPQGRCWLQSGASPTFWLAAFHLLPVNHPRSIQRTAWKDSCLCPMGELWGAAIGAQHGVVDRTLIIQGRMSRWPPLGAWPQLPSSPKAAGDPGRLPRSILPAAQSGCHHWTLQQKASEGWPPSTLGSPSPALLSSCAHRVSPPGCLRLSTRRGG